MMWDSTSQQATRYQSTSRPSARLIKRGKHIVEGRRPDPGAISRKMPASRNCRSRAGAVFSKKLPPVEIGQRQWMRFKRLHELPASNAAHLGDAMLLQDGSQVRLCHIVLEGTVEEDAAHLADGPLRAVPGDDAERERFGVRHGDLRL